MSRQTYGPRHLTVYEVDTPFPLTVFRLVRSENRMTPSS